MSVSFILTFHLQDEHQNEHFFLKSKSIFVSSVLNIFQRNKLAP